MGMDALRRPETESLLCGTVSPRGDQQADNNGPLCGEVVSMVGAR